MNFDLNAIWSRAMELVRDNFQLLAVIAGIFLLLPTLATYLLLPDMQEFMDPNADPDAIAALVQEIALPLFAVGMVSFIFTFAGYGAMVALMSDARPTVGEALKRGLRITPSTFGVLVLFVIAYFVGALVVMIPISLVAAAIEVPALSAIAFILVFAFVIWLLARMSMSMPVLVLENSLNPVKAVTRSFKLTKPKQWQIIAFWGVLFLAYFVIALLLTSIFGLIAAIAGNSTMAALILGLANGILGMVIGMIVCGLAVAMYGQLAGPSDAEIAETFD